MVDVAIAAPEPALPVAEYSPAWPVPVKEPGQRTADVSDESYDAAIARLHSDLGAIGNDLFFLADRSYAKECQGLIDAILIHHLNNPVPVAPDQFRDELKRILRRGAISRTEYQQLRRIDAVAYDLADDSTIAKYAVAQVSIVASKTPIDKVAWRRDIIRRATRMPTDAFVITEDAGSEIFAEYAAAKGVTIVMYESKYANES